MIQFKPGIASTIATAVVVPCLVALGFWQLDRAQQKTEIFAHYQARMNAPELALQAPLPASDDLLWRRIRATGQFVGPNLILDNRVRNGQVGYEVFTPLILANEARVLVGRGWVAADGRRKPVVSLQIPSAAQTITGRIGPLPWNGIQLGEPPPPERLSPDLVRVERLDLASLNSLLHAALPPYIIMLDPSLPEGYDRAWPAPTSDVGKHRAYAVQWFAMAAVLAIIYLKINLTHSSP